MFGTTLPDPPCRRERSATPSGGLLAARMLRYRSPRWWQELGIITVVYWLYGQVQDLAPARASVAFRHAAGVQDLQEALHLDFELSVNRFVAAHTWLAQAMDYYYASLHFVLTAGVLVWLYRWHANVYRGARTVLGVASLIGLLGFYLYPLAPPRLVPQYGYVDTVLELHTWGSLAAPDIAQHSDQFAAMPSLHVAWSLWCGITIYRCARRPVVRAVGLLYPLVTLTVVIGTANHFLLDAVAGALVVAVAFRVQALLSGHGAYTPPLDAPVPARSAA